MRHDLRWPLGFLFVGMWALLFGGRAYAQTDTSLDVVNVDVSAYPEVALTVDVPDGLGTSWTATVEENGTTRPATVQTGARGAIEVVLALDTSGSMAGPPLDAAKSAAVTFVRQLPPGARAAVVGFGNTPYVVSPMTDDRSVLETAIDGLEASGETALYDALELGTTQFSLTDLPRSVVLVSDGGDTTSAATLDDATGKLVGAKVRLFALRMATRETNDGALETLATATHGRAVDGVDAADLTNAYQQIAGSALRQVRLTYRSAGHGATPVRVEVANGDLRSSTTVSLSLPAPSTATTVDAAATPAADAVTSGSDADGAESQLLLGAGALFCGLLLLGHRAFGRPPTSLLASTRRPRRSSGLRDLKARFGAAMERSLERRGRRDALGKRLEDAGIALRPGEYLVLAGGATGLGFFVGLLLGGGAVAILFAALAVVVAWMLLGSRTKKRRAELEQRLPDLLQQLTATLRAGYGIMQSFDSVAREIDGPMGDELRRVVHEVQLGRPLTESLEAMAGRVGGDDFGWVVQAIEINAEVGGDLVDVLEAVASTVRAREQLRRRIKTLSAQGRLSARILLAMPFVMAVLLSLLHPGFLSPLVENSAGPILLAIGVVLMTVGKVWLRRIVRLQF